MGGKCAGIGLRSIVVEKGAQSVELNLPKPNGAPPGLPRPDGAPKTADLVPSPDK